MLANMTLDGLEQTVKDCVPHNKGYKVNVVRYADDFIVTGDSKETLETKVLPAIQRFMKDRGLELSPEKTRITEIHDGFDFLGVNIRKYGDTLLTKPSEKSQKSLTNKVKEVLQKMTHASQEKVIEVLNPILRGWASYHHHGVAKKVFGNMDNEIWYATWRWAKRRHPNKSAYWIKSKYFHRNGDRNGSFSVLKTPSGKPSSLFNLVSAPIQRHIKIRAEAHPYDPQWKKYFCERRRRNSRSVARYYRKCC